jgi:hypothetical protein
MWGKTSLATPREANFGFFQSLLVVSGIGNSKLVTLRPNMASQWNKSTGQSLSQELVFPQTSWTKSPLASYIVLKSADGAAETYIPSWGGTFLYSFF